MAAAAVNGKIYVIGGAPAVQGPVLPLVEEYDPAADSWTPKTDMPTARTGFAAEVVNGRIYAIGGTTVIQGPGIQTVEEYNPAMDEWVARLDMPTARVFLQAGTLDGKIYALGGVVANIGPDLLTTVEEYDAGVVPTAVRPRPKLASIWGSIKTDKWTAAGVKR